MLPIILTALALTIPAFSADLAGCESQLVQSMCYTQPVDHWASAPDIIKGLKSFQERKCRPMPPKIKQTLLSIYHQYPRELQQAFCEIKKVFIVSGDVPHGALAEYYFDVSTVKVQEAEWNHRFSGKPIGYVLELSEKNRFKGESAPAYLTRVLRARFGNTKGAADQLPLAEYENPFAENGALATTIVHEIGHMLGRSQKVTSTFFLPLTEGPWSKLSFKMDADQYVLRHATSDYGFNLTSRMLGAEDVKPTFELFRKTGIATLYGATVPQEDFAEFFMFNFYGNLKWSVNGKVAFDLQKEMASNAAFKTKKEIIGKLMSLPAPFSLKTRGTVSGEIGSL